MNDEANTEKIVKSELAMYLGINITDIDNDDSIIQDLHLKPNDITDFLEILSEKGFDTSKIDFKEVDTVFELIESLND